MACLDGLCSWGFSSGRLSCSSSGGSYSRATALDANLSEFYDDTLREATYKLRDVFSQIPDDPNGRVLGLINTRKGFLLAWVEHNDETPEPGITIENSEEEIAKALGLIDIESAA